MIELHRIRYNMDMLMERHHIKNIEGTIMKEDSPLIEIKVVNYNLEKFVELSRYENWRYYPPEFYIPVFHGMDITYFHVDSFFKHRVVQDGAQDIDLYLKAMGLDHYDLDELVKRTNGFNFMNYFWFKMPNYGAKKYKELRKQEYPVLK